MVYESVSRGDSVFFNFGKGTNKISPGTYEFEFKYVIVNQISCNENQDYCELTWDVNGFNSGYAIDQLICIVSAEENNVLSYPRSYMVQWSQTLSVMDLRGEVLYNSNQQRKCRSNSIKKYNIMREN